MRASFMKKFGGPEKIGEARTNANSNTGSESGFFVVFNSSVAN